MDPAHVPYAHHGIMKIPKRPGPPPPDRYVYLNNFSFLAYESCLHYFHLQFIPNLSIVQSVVRIQLLVSRIFATSKLVTFSYYAH